MPRRKKADYAELCDVLRIKINAARAAQAADTGRSGKGLSEPVTPLTDTGVRVGDPRAAEKRRTAQIEGAAGTGTVQVPRKVEGKGLTKSGKPRMTTKMVDVPATEAHVREALNFWRARRVTSDASRERQNEMVSLLARRLEAIVGAQVARYDEASKTVAFVSVPVREQVELSAKVDTAQAHRGPTLVRGRAMEAAVVRGPRERGEKPVSTSLEGPLGRERFDKTITDVPAPKVARTPSQRRAWRRKQAKAHRTP